jgi:iron complex outermembrane receptor protein
VVSLENGVRGTTGDGEFTSLGFDWKALPRLALQGDFEYYAKHVPEQGGVSLVSPTNGVVPITPVPDPRNLLSGRWAKLRADTKNVQLRADFVLLEGWRVLAEAGRSYAYRKRFTVRIRNYAIETGAGSASISTVNQEYTNSFERLELLGRFSTWFLRHDLTIGVSRSRRESATPSQNTATSQPQNIYHPVVLDEPVYTMAPTSLALQFSQDIGVYGYDTISIGPKFKFLLGVRITRDKEDNGVKRGATTVATPAVGALYDILPSLTVFASFMEGLEGGATAPVGALNVYEILPSAVSSQKEVGIRVSALQEVTASASAFQIIRANAVTDPVTTVFSEAGDIDYKGIEATISVEILRRLTLDVAGQWMHAIQRAPGNPINGLVPENTPSLLGNARLTYGPQWVPGLTLNVAASGVTKRYVNPQDQGTIPGYVLLSAGIGYQMRIQKTRFAFQLTGDNLANIRYWNSVQTGTYGTGMDRAFKFSAKVGF